MTYGPVQKWKFPFQKKIEVRTPDVRTFLLLCTLAIFLIAIWFSYCSLGPTVSEIQTINSDDTYSENSKSQKSAYTHNARVRTASFQANGSSSLSDSDENITAADDKLADNTLADDADAVKLTNYGPQVLADFSAEEHVERVNIEVIELSENVKYVDGNDFIEDEADVEGDIDIDDEGNIEDDTDLDEEEGDSLDIDDQEDEYEESDGYLGATTETPESITIANVKGQAKAQESELKDEVHSDNASGIVEQMTINWNDPRLDILKMVK